MPNKSLLKNSTVLLVLLIFSALAWGDQKKTENRPAQVRPAPQVKSAPAPKSTPSRPAPAFNRGNTGVVNRPNTGAGYKPATGAGFKQPNTGAGYKPATGVGNRPITGMGNQPATGAGFKQPNTGAGYKPATGVGNRPITGMGNQPATGMGNKPVTGAGYKPATGMGNRPITGMGNQPATGVGNRPITGVGNQPATGMGNKPVTGAGYKPATGMGNRPITGMGNQPATGMGNRPITGVGSRPTGVGANVGTQGGTNFGTRGGMAQPGYRTTTRTFTDHSGHPASATFRPGGRVATIHAKGMTINHGIHGGRTIVAERNGRTIVSTGRSGGYVQRPYFNRGGRAYYQRTYVVGGRSYVRVYRGYDYRGVRYYGYAPVYYYHPRFYGWAYNPWMRPVYYGPAAWGWVGMPWFGFYGGFFTPYPVYTSASLWLTDYLIAASLQAAYQARLDAAAAAGGGEAPAPAENYAPPPSGGPEASNQTQLTPEVKQAIADEVQRQLAAENAAAANPQAAPSSDQVPDALNPAERVFVVASNLDVTAPDSGQECSLTPGDVVMRLSDTPDNNQNVTASVQSSKKGDCGTGQTVAVGVQDLQEMHNQFREQLDSGLKTLADKGGTGGLPKPPDTGTTNGEVPPPTPDSAAADQLQAQQQQADQTEAQAAQNYQ